MSHEAPNTHSVLREQAARFARLTALTFVASVTSLGPGNLGWKSLGAAFVGAAEVAYKQMKPHAPGAGPK